VRRCLLLALLLALSVAAPAGATSVAAPPTRPVPTVDGTTDRWLLGGRWLYRADPADTGIARGWWGSTSDAGWTPVRVPNAEGADDLTPAADLGQVGWYRRDFTAPAGAFARSVPASARDWIVRFESVNYQATVWLNGRLIGGHASPGVPFELTLGRLHDTVNRLVVRVDNRRSPLDLPPGVGGWWNFGGLLREVELRAVPGVEIAQAAVVPELACPHCPATVHETVTVRNLTAGPERVQLAGTYGTAPVRFGGRTLAPRASWTARATVRIAHPDLWSIGHPALYRATLALTDGTGHPLDGYLTESGIRLITLTPDGRLELNGRRLSLRGVEVREQAAGSGGALTPAQEGRLVGWVRALGATLIRAELPSPELQELADRDGLLIWSEIPVSALTPDADLIAPAWRARADGLLGAEIAADGNHPSILVWGIGNELTTPDSANAAAYIAHETALARALDPSRPVGMAVSDWPGLGCRPALAPLQVIGVNEYFGYYDANGTTDDRDALSPYLDGLRACYPHQALMVSEFGFDANRAGPVEERGTYAFQSVSAAYHLHVYATKPWLSGAIYFDLQDAAAAWSYAGGNPWPSPPFNDKGLLTLAGTPKPAFAVVAAIFHHTRQIGPAPPS
jgi:beta-glucuronidase